MNLIEYLKQTINKFPDKVAIQDDLGSLTFLELDNISNTISKEIITSSPFFKKPIAVFLPKNRWSVISFVGVFKSGNFYVPMDVKAPSDRLLKIFDTLDTPCIITNLEYKNLIPSCYNGKIIIIEDVICNVLEQKDHQNLDKIANEIIDLDPIYSIFTSGSTGNPKGVLISHRGVIDYINWAIKTYNITEEEIIGSQAPFYFDNSTLDIYLMMLTGAKLVIIPEDKFMFPLKLIEFINIHNINFVFWVPSVLVSISNFKVLDVLLPKSLKKILFAGEVMPNKHLNYWRNFLPDLLFSNLYGPTEITVDCTYYIVDRHFNDDEPLPIGIPCRNSDIIILSNEDQLVTEDEVGELCVRGSSLALGYYKNPETTKLSFVQNPLHNDYNDIIYKTGDLAKYNARGEILFLGRKDSQIKHMGYRIELGEIENGLLSLKEIKNVCVVYKDDLSQIEAFYVGDIKAPAIRRQLASILPKYMLPRKFYQMEYLPTNSNGKIDRKKLKNDYELL